MTTTAEPTKAAPRRASTPAAPTTGSGVNWAQLERMEFDSLSDIWQWCQTGARLAGDSGLIVLQARADLHMVLKAITAMGAEGKARRVTRRLNRAVNHLAGVKNEFARIPGDIMKVYAEEIEASRRPQRRRIDLAK